MSKKFNYYLAATVGNKNYNFQWIKEGGKSVKIFPSGLVQITQSFVAPKDTYTKLKEQFNEGDAYSDSAPCIDGAFIFPKPEIQFIDGNFVRQTVIAYGRANTEGTTTVSKEYRGNIPKLFYVNEAIEDSEGKIIRYELRLNRAGRSTASRIVDFITKKFVIPKNDNLQLDLTVPQTTGEVKNGILLTTYNLSGTQMNNIPNPSIVAPGPRGYSFDQRDVDLIISEYYPSQLDVVNFGEWNEVTAVIRDNILFSNEPQVSEQLRILNESIRP